MNNSPFDDQYQQFLNSTNPTANIQQTNVNSNPVKLTKSIIETLFSFLVCTTSIISNSPTSTIPTTKSPTLSPTNLPTIPPTLQSTKLTIPSAKLSAISPTKLPTIPSTELPAVSSTILST